MRALIKRAVMWGYCLGWMSAETAGRIFKKYKLGGA